MKKYLADLLGDRFKTWGKRKILITAPTGVGKTTFVVKTLLPYLENRSKIAPPWRRKKLLILCNRKLLRDQYWYSLIAEHVRYKDLRESVDIKTYQELAEEIKSGNIDNLFTNYSMIICDECHFFYADADFNGFGTFVVLQTIFYAGINLPIVFMSATMKEVEPLIRETLEKLKKEVRRSRSVSDESVFEFVVYDFGHLEDFSNFKCVAVPDEDTLCREIAIANGKAIIFIDDCAAADRMAKKIQTMGELNKKDIAVLDAESVDNDKNSEVIKALTMNHLCIPKVLITTSVLDNGVSIEDPDVENVVIITESRISFLQMLGRVRAGYTDEINLYFLLRQPGFFAQREENYRFIVTEIDRVSKINCNRNRFSIIDIAWGEDRLAKIYRKIFTPCPEKLAFFFHGDQIVHTVYGDTHFALNSFVREKVGNDYLCECKLHKAAMKKPVEVVYIQMTWLGKDRTELVEIRSSYKENMIEKFVEDALQIQDLSNEEFVKAKAQMAQKYRKELFPDLVKKDASFESKKLEIILERYDLKLVKEERGSKTFYSVKKEKA